MDMANVRMIPVDFEYRFKLRSPVPTTFRTPGYLVDLFPEFEHRGAVAPLPIRASTKSLEDTVAQSFGAIAQKWDVGFGLSCHFAPRPEYEVRGRARSYDEATRGVRPVLERIETYFKPTDLVHGEITLSLNGIWAGPDLLTATDDLLPIVRTHLDEHFEHYIEGPRSSSGVQRIVRIRRQLRREPGWDHPAAVMPGAVSCAIRISYIVTSDGSTPIPDATAMVLATHPVFENGFARCFEMIKETT